MSDDDRVGHRALHLALQLLVLLDVGREAVEDGVEDAADLAGGDQLDVELVEDLGVILERVGEGGAGLDLGLDREQDLLHRRVVGLAGEDARGTAPAADRRRSSSRTSG